MQLTQLDAQDGFRENANKEYYGQTWLT